MNTYNIDTPPPTISGNLHIGHLFSYAQADIIASYQKYCGKDLLYPFCFDNNGIPTQKLAANKGIKEIDQILQFSIQKGLEYCNTFKEAGIEFSIDAYHTYDTRAIDIAYQAFDVLKKKGIAYKKEAQYLYCPIQKISISQSELNDDGIIERSGVMPEIKTGTGWFINLMDHLKDIKKMINQIDFQPFKYRQSMLNWCDNLKWDWSISRERKYGIRIPNEELTFDTWFISALTPQLAYASRTFENKLQIPIFDMRYQSHDIIRTWAFYTIAMSYFLNNQIPWHTLMITGHALDGSGDKFSKSSGNATAIKPLLDKYGIAGIRHWACSNTLGTDTKLDEIKMKMGWRLKNKFENAKKFIQMQTDNNWIGQDDSLLLEWNSDKKEILQAFENFKLDQANALMYKFFWNKFCDIWIERSKKESISITLNQILTDFEPIFKIIYK